MTGAQRRLAAARVDADRLALELRKKVTEIRLLEQECLYEAEKALHDEDSRTMMRLLNKFRPLRPKQTKQILLPPPPDVDPLAEESDD